jgi:hypothetical protein
MRDHADNHEERIMKTRYAMLFGPPVTLALAVCAADQTSRELSAVTDAHQGMIEALKAQGPHSSLGEQAKVFGRLVGNWDVEYSNYRKDGSVKHRSGELLVGWVMDGRAVQDVWIVYPSGERKVREIYTDVRYFDSKSSSWPATFIDPEHATVAKFEGGAVGSDRIVLETKDLDDPETRWSFVDIRPDTFGFREETSGDGGKTWKLEAEYHMKRRGTAPVAP